MGYIAQWSEMMETLFQDMYFFVDWYFLPDDEEGDILEEVGQMKRRGRGEKAGIKKRLPDTTLWMEEYYPVTREKFARMPYTRRINEPFYASGEAVRLFEAYENVTWGDMAKYPKMAVDKGAEIVHTDLFEAYEKSFDAVGEGERREKMGDLSCHAMPEWEKNYAPDLWGKDAPVTGMADLFEKMSNYGEYTQRDVIALSREKAERIIKGAVKTEGDAKGEKMVIERVKSAEKYTMPDMDDTLDMLTERLCDLMSKGAEGFYM